MNIWLKNNPISLLLTIVFSLAVYISVIAFTPHQTLEIVFLDVGQGDATLITTPNGRQVLIDTGAKNNIGQSLARYMPLTDRSLDLVILTHPDTDHVGGMVSLLDRYHIDIIVHSGLLAGASIYSAIAENIKNDGIPTLAAHAGQVITIDKGVYLEILSPHENLDSFEANDYSVVARLVYKDTSLLLMGDATKLIEQEVVNTYGPKVQSDILKVGHHGSQTSTSSFFVEEVAPEYAVISLGCNNRFGHPHMDVLATLFSYQVEIFDTCNDGDIIFESDGEMWTNK